MDSGEKMTNLEKLLAEARELDGKATPGPWIVDMGNWSVESANENVWRAEICGIAPGDRDTLPEWPNKVHPYDDGEFIAKARTLLPKLAEIVEATVGELKKFHSEAARHIIDRAEEIAKCST